jgi:hypothetical protein
MTRKTEEQWVEKFAEEYGREPDSQELHDWMTRRRFAKPLQPGSKQRLEKLLKSKETAFDPIENAMRAHPGLTRERAEEMARAAGF